MKNKTTKPVYRIRNWSQYNAALTKRGSLTLWVDQAAIDQWLCLHKPARRGRPLKYADAAIQACLLLREAFHLPLRQTQGLTRSIFHLLELASAAREQRVMRRGQVELEQVEEGAGKSLSLAQR